jgi:hypothetical protein
MVVKYDARPVMVTLLDKGALAPSVAMNGSLISFDGDMTGVGSVDGTALELFLECLPDECRAVLFPDGEARRESVLRKVDLRLMGGGREDASMGRSGSLTLGFESRSL